MTILRFKSSDKLKKLASETLCRKEFLVPYQKKTTTKKLFWFVKDSGIYLMNGWGNQVAEDNVVVYAKGYEPESDDCWERCREAVGGDDFGEGLTMSKDMLTRLVDGGDMILRVKGKGLEWEA
tara:strand:- start:2039 stop:2407 length:369 start_codon:yes stop_codon:yes gene_type:complete